MNYRLGLISIAAIATVCAASPAAAQDARGYWQGALQIGPTRLTIGVAIEAAADGSLTGTLDSPDQGSYGIALDNVRAGDDGFAFRVPAIGATYAATWNAAEQRWDGVFEQAGMRLPLELTAGTRPETKPAGKSALPANWTIPAPAEVDRLIDGRLASRPGIGMVITAIDGDRQQTTKGGPAGIDADSVFEIGSMTKVFTALLLAQMALDGTVKLDDPVAKYLPADARMPERGGRQITLRNLSQQDSGLPRLPDNMRPADISDPYADYTEAQLLEFLGRFALRRDIGSEYEYSNLGVGLLGYSLARAEGTDFETLLRRRILDPLGMKDTAITLSDGQKQRFVTGHDEFLRPTSAWSLPSLAGAGALRSTANDVATFLRAALNPQSPIAPAMKLALAERRDAPGFAAGLGWMMVPAPGGELAMHSGGTGGFRSFMAIQPATDRAVVVLTNSALEPSAQDLGLHMLVGAPIATAAPPMRAPAQVERREVTLADEQLNRVTGTYRMAPGVDMVIARAGSGLTAAITGQGALPLFPRAPLEFFWRAVNAEIVFTEEDGRITGAVFTQDGNSMPLVRTGTP